MENKIVKKLNAEMRLAIDSERQVVYILAGTLKLLDLGAYSKDEWRNIRFLCDWVMHVGLDRNSGWQRELLAQVDQVIAAGLSWDDLGHEQKKFFTDNFSLSGMRESLMEFYRQNSIIPKISSLASSFWLLNSDFCLPE